MRLTEKAILETIESIYDAGIDKESWNHALKKLCDVTGCASSTMMLRSHQRLATDMHADYEIDPHAWKVYNEHFWSTDLWTANGSKVPSGAARYGEELVPHNELIRSEWYNDFCQPNKFERLLVGIMDNNKDRFWHISIFRSHSLDTFDEETKKVFTQLLPHLRRSAELGMRLSLLSDWKKAAVNFLDGLPFGILLVGNSQKILYANKYSQNVFAQCDGLKTKSGEIVALNSNINKKIYRFLKISTLKQHDDLHQLGSTISVPRPSGRRHYSLLVAPIWRTAEKTVLFEVTADSPAAIVIIVDPEFVAIPLSERLQDQFDLTAAEAEATSLLVSGMTIDEIAIRLGKTSGTVRNQIKCVFGKTDTDRQSALIRLLMSDVTLVMNHILNR